MFNIETAALAANAAAKNATIMPMAILRDQMDNGLTLTIYSGNLPIRHLLRHLEYSWQNDRNNPLNRRERKYRDSGLMSLYRGDDGPIELSVSVGCSCEHDCCAHLCRLSYHIHMVQGYWHVYCQTAHNI